MDKGTIVHNANKVIGVLIQHNLALEYVNYQYDPKQNFEIFKEGFGGFDGLYNEIAPLTSLFRQTIGSCLNLDPARDKMFLEAISRDLRRILLLAKDITAKLSGNKDLKSPGLSINLMSAYFSFWNNISDFSSYTGIAISYKTENDKAGQRSNKLPIELDTPEAQKYFARAIERGFILPIPTGYKWEGSLKELALFASIMSEKLNFEGVKWKIFESLFDVKYLAQAKYKAINIHGKFSDRQKEIEEILED